jgi:hypothetical protein
MNIPRVALIDGLANGGCHGPSVTHSNRVSWATRPIRSWLCKRALRGWAASETLDPASAFVETLSYSSGPSSVADLASCVRVCARLVRIGSTLRSH